MPVFHRFYSFFPVVLVFVIMAFALGGCTATSGKPVWTQQTKAEASAEAAPVPPIANRAPQAMGTVKVAILLPLSGAQSAVGQSIAPANQRDEVVWLPLPPRFKLSAPNWCAARRDGSWAV